MKEKDPISKNKLDSFYKYVNRKLFCHSSIGDITNQDGSFTSNSLEMLTLSTPTSLVFIACNAVSQYDLKFQHKAKPINHIHFANFSCTRGHQFKLKLEFCSIFAIKIWNSL